ncbi:MAG: diaminopimelate epimerase [Planctomycetales bacterium]|nr:diaminopimelate epimerase [bacterium]UNM08408.1 MAG: diaminopimelate epimerase [Planctomycetales bacterium]
MQALRFHKMHGCGNDFIVFDDEQDRFSWDELSQLARRYCPRRFGVGADGLIAIGRHPGADYEMRYVNADGSRAEMCGNGIRCVGKFVGDELGDIRSHIKVMTGNGVLPISLSRLAGKVDSITVGMGVPGLKAASIPTTLKPISEPVLATELAVDGTILSLTAVNMGNPHAVSFVDSITDQLVLGIGPQVEKHPVFPEGVNVEFVQVLAPENLRMRVWERGVGETWACGTGACATVVAAVLNGHSRPGSDVTVKLNGGKLIINWPGEGKDVQMTGPAEFVYHGFLGLD